MSKGGLGGYNPAPFGFGSSAGTTLEALQEALATAKGTALAKDRGTVVWVENAAQARVLWDLYNATERAGMQGDPAKLAAGILERWEAILRLIPDKTDTMIARRARVAAKLGLIGKGTTVQVLHDYLATTVGEIYQGLAFTDPTDAITYIPGGGVIPGGPTLLDGNALLPNASPYLSTLAYVAILLAQPASMPNDKFYALAGRIYEDVDGLVGAWMGFDWVKDGINGAGFFLDEDMNLDNERFDE